MMLVVGTADILAAGGTTTGRIQRGSDWRWLVEYLRLQEILQSPLVDCLYTTSVADRLQAMRIQILNIALLCAEYVVFSGCSKSPPPQSKASRPPTTEESRETVVPPTIAEEEIQPPAPTVKAKPEPVQHEVRHWKDRSGKFDVAATFLAWEAGKVALRRDNGTVSVVPVEKLSKADHDYLQGQGVLLFTKRQIVGRVVGVTDGDTITVLGADNKQHKIRLVGIDAPENKQQSGTQSRKALSAKVFQKEVQVDWYEHDTRGLVLGDVFVDDRFINLEMIQEGLAWHYKKYSHDPKLADAENSARRVQSGLWAAPSPTAPWDYRLDKERKPATVAKVSEPNPNADLDAKTEKFKEWALKNTAVTDIAINSRITMFVTLTSDKYTNRDNVRVIAETLARAYVNQVGVKYASCHVYFGSEEYAVGTYSR